MTVRQAIGHLPQGSPEKHAPQVLEQWHRRGRYVGSFHSIRLDPDKPSPTMVKAHLHWHYAVPRHITTEEAGLLASFPSRYKWVGGVNDVKERLGNCVPPKFAQAIATCIREHVLGDREFTYLSTFAGCGGSSLGYKWAGGHGVAAVEFDANAAATYRANFPDTPVLERDIATVTAEELLALTGLKAGELDVLDGSPPCQGFSTAGKREFSDPRNGLFREYVRLIEGLQPKVFVMENVSGMVKGKMRLAFREIMLALKATGYQVRCKLLNAMYYEVPQSRERLIWIGVRGDIGNEPGFPEPVGKPVTVAQALSNVNVQDGPAPTLSALAKSRYAETKRGSRHTQRFSTVRLNWDSVCPTIVKERGSGGLFHPDEPRLLSVGELKRIASFPDSWKFVGTYDNALNRIGNSVPPRFMYHIAKHIRDHILRLANGREPVA